MRVVQMILSANVQSLSFLSSVRITMDRGASWLVHSAIFISIDICSVHLFSNVGRGF